MVTVGAVLVALGFALALTGNLTLTFLAAGLLCTGGIVLALSLEQRHPGVPATVPTATVPTPPEPPAEAGELAA